MSSPRPRWVRAPEDLPGLLSTLAGVRTLALDSESDSLHHHREKVCLIQLATDRGEACLVDPLALRELPPLFAALADPGVLTVVHGADYDVTTLKRDFGFRFARLFDTMIAARFLGLPEIGLQALLRTELSIEVSKASQKDDWSRRPLTPVQEEYAVADVRHLLALHARLSARLAGQGRLAWVEEECAAVAALEPARRGRDPQAWQKVKGARRLSGRQQAVLRELFAWREGVAESTDIPAFRILSSEVLLALAEAPPRTPPELARVRGLPPRVQREGPALLRAVARALALPEADLPRTPAAPRPVVLPEVKTRVDALRAWRATAARHLGVDVSVVLPQRLLDKVAEAGPAAVEGLEQVEGLRRWRIEALGAEMVAAVRGALALRRSGQA